MKKFDWNKPMSRKDWGILYLICILSAFAWYAVWMRDYWIKPLRERIKKFKKKIIR